MGDDFTATKFRWLDQVVADRELSPLTFHVAYLIAGHLNRSDGQAWPSQSTLAGLLDVTDRAVRKCVDQLLERHHLGVERESRRGSNRYTPILRDRNNGSSPDRAETGTVVPLSEGLTGTTVPPSGLDDRNSGSSPDAFERNNGSGGTGTVVPPNPLIEPFDRERGKNPPSPIAVSRPRKTPSPKPENDEAFATWWNLYPRREGKADARRAFDAVVAEKRATLAELSAGAMRYAAERERDPRMTTDPEAWKRFTALPGSWLRGERWQDEAPVARSSNVIDEFGRPVAAPAAARIDAETDRLRTIHGIDPDAAWRHIDEQNRRNNRA